VTIKLPKEAGDLLDEIEQANWPSSTQLRLKAVGFRLAKDEVDRLRELERDKLLTLAQDIFSWCLQLVRLPTTSRIWDVLGEKTRIMVFWSKYFRRRPLSDNDMSGQASLRVGKIAETKESLSMPILWYEEQYKWFPAISHEIRTPEELVDTVHPRFLKEFHRLLLGPEPWKWVLKDIQRRRPEKKD